jgi:hypothetical protein
MRISAAKNKKKKTLKINIIKGRLPEKQKVPVRKLCHAGNLINLELTQDSMQENNDDDYRP